MENAYRIVLKELIMIVKSVKNYVQIIIIYLSDFVIWSAQI